MGKLNDAYLQYKEKYKTTCWEKIADEKFLNIETYRCHLNNGVQFVRSRLLKNGRDGDAVIIIALTTDGQAILVMQPRSFTEETVEISFPAGLIDEGEDPLTAAKRELLEEVGATAQHWRHLLTVYQDEAISGAKISYYLAEGCVLSAKQKLDPTEYIDFVVVDLEEAMSLLDMSTTLVTPMAVSLLLLKSLL